MGTMMEKALYELKINEELMHLIPPLRAAELELLEEKILDEGCRDPLVVWKETGELLDGHNRYRICKENGIPFSYTEESLEDLSAAKLWIGKNQLGRRNVTDFVKCELVFPLEEQLKADAEKRRRRAISEYRRNGETADRSKKSIDILAEMAGVSRDTMRKAKKLIGFADEETKGRLRTGELSIHGAYKAMMNKTQPGDEIEETSSDPVIISKLPRFSLASNKNSDALVPEFDAIHEMMGIFRPKKGYTPPSDDDDDEYDDFKRAEERERSMRERDMAIIEGEMRSAMNYFVEQVAQILSMMKPGFKTKENIEEMRVIVIDAVNKMRETIDNAIEPCQHSAGK